MKEEVRSMKAMIFDLQRASFVDGPGIRTTVFFKGCNLRCQWCHNPESQHLQPERMYYANKCIRCGKCISVCRAGALRMSKNEIGYEVENCQMCGRCELFCPQSAIKFCGKEWTLEQVMEQLRQDRAFYTQSGGGVTFSGGECLLQADFVVELAKSCASEGISVAIDTAGNVSWEVFEPLLSVTEWFLYDVKCYSNERHWAGTGVSNERILENLRKLLKICPEKVWIRTPIIPGFNAQETEIAAIAAFLKQNGKPKKWELLPYHRLGEGKNMALNRKEFHTEVPSEEQMERLRQAQDF